MYNIKAVSTMTHIPATTIRAWEMRYGAVSPLRSKSGYRLYSESDIEDLRWLKQQTELQGITISQAVQQLRESKQRREQGTPPRKSQPQPALSFEKLIQQLYEALAAFRVDEANRLLEIGFSMFAYQELFIQVLAPLMRRVGEDWEGGRLSVAQEHLVSQFVTQRFFQFFRLFPVDPALPHVLAFCPPGEHHQIGLLLFTLFLRQNHVEVLYLGPDTPFDGLVELIAAKDISIVSISVTREESVADCLQIIEGLTRKFPRLRFVLGGQAAGSLGSKLQRFVLDATHESWREWFEQHVKNFRG
ncbi:MerR family transcriptional regulator [Paenibacillus athensensis]|nr:MerR family transcriptional regulator [Paenibacillus athensensis]MCD1257522.1 MerR family transcriptional regulator [Paenibacillus athensensis]